MYIAFTTVITGTFVFILGQVFLEFVLKPVKEYRKVIAEIDNKLKYYSNVVVNPAGILPPEIKFEANNELRSLSCSLEAAYKQLPIRRNSKQVSEAAKILIFLSNTVYSDGLALQKSDQMDELRSLLNIS